MLQIKTDISKIRAAKEKRRRSADHYSPGLSTKKYHRMCQIRLGGGGVIQQTASFPVNNGQDSTCWLKAAGQRVVVLKFIIVITHPFEYYFRDHDTNSYFLSDR